MMISDETIPEVITEWLKKKKTEFTRFVSLHNQQFDVYNTDVIDISILYILLKNILRKKYSLRKQPWLSWRKER